MTQAHIALVERIGERDIEKLKCFKLMFSFDGSEPLFISWRLTTQLTWSSSLNCTRTPAKFQKDGKRQ
jgi:hypothetical protein